MPKLKSSKWVKVAKAAPAAPPTKPPLAVQTRPRRLRLPIYKVFHLQPPIKHPVVLPSVWRLSQKTFAVLWRYRGLLLGVALIYGLLNILFIRGLSGGTDVAGLKQQLSQALHGDWGQVAVSVSVFTTLLASSGNNSSATAGSYQLFLGLIVSLATIWILRQTAAGETVRLRDAFYKGMYPFIPFMLVLLIVLLQTAPFLLGGGLYVLIVNNGIAVYFLEKLLWGLLFAVLTLVSAYMLCSSVFALYIVTLPDMTPLKALRSARQLVRYRRPSVFRKLLFLPVSLFLLGLVIMAPIILFVPVLAPWIFLALTMLGLVVVHAYLYTLYRELLV